MHKLISLFFTAGLCLAISACAVSNKQQTSDNNLHWDFDHQLQYRQSKLSNNAYQLEVIPNSKVSFERMASFLLRKSYLLCQSYHYQLELLQGIEGFNDKLGSPNYIFPSLTAKVACSSE